MSKVLVTGASGFIGSGLTGFLTRSGYSVCAAVRDNSALSLLPGDDMKHVAVGSICASTDWSQALDGVDAIVHLAGRAHVLQETHADALSLFRTVNRDGTLHLARMAAEAGVRRFVFVSSIGVNGNQTLAVPFSEKDTPNPRDFYAISKFEAELGLREIAARTSMEVVILRPPLVYGPGAPGNFRRLIDIVQKGLPLPFGRINNRRSLLYLDNFTDAIRLCIEHPKAAGHTFLVSDGEDVSTPELIRRIAHALHRPARLLAVPVSLLRLAGRVTGKSAAVSRLTGSLQVDGDAIRQRLGWIAPYSMQDGLAATVAEFVQDRASARTTVKS